MTVETNDNNSTSIKCENRELSKEIAKEIQNNLDNLKTPEDFQTEFDKLLETLEQTIKLLLKELSNLMDTTSTDCEMEVRYKQLLKQLQEEYKLYEALYEYLQSHQNIVKELLEKVKNGGNDNGTKVSHESVMEKLKENVRHYTEKGKYKQMLQDKTYMFRYNTHYGYALGAGVMAMLVFTVYSSYKH